MYLQEEHEAVYKEKLIDMQNDQGYMFAGFAEILKGTYTDITGLNDIR